ncbi:MAG: envelope stress response membrane protein PspB [Gammaproteobacteria bacterium]|nr:envelope stress response membrane protein PspB [Gammaproteobacteria bacterium]
MDELFPLIFVPTLLFMVVVAPIWIINHYRVKGRTNASLTEDERLELERLVNAAAGMRERIETLESILDAETPGWRGRPGVAESRLGVRDGQE